MTSAVHGHADARFDKVADALADELSTGAEVGAAIAIDIDGELGRRHLGRPRRRGQDRPVGRGHDRQRLVEHQDRDEPGRADAGRSRSARPRRAGRHVLAGVRRQRQAGRQGAPPAVAHLRRRGLAGTDDHRRSLRLGEGDVAAGRPGAVVGAGHRVGLSGTQFRLSDRRAGSPHRREVVEGLRPRRHRAPTRRGLPDSAPARGRWPDRGADSSAAVRHPLRRSCPKTTRCARR